MAAIVGVFVNRLIPVITEEYSLLRDIDGQVEGMKDELESIACFLVVADAIEARGDSYPNLQAWVTHVGDIAYDIEDVIHEYMHYVARRRQEPRAYRYVRATDRYVRKLVTRHEIASRVEDIMEKIVEIKKRAERYHLTGSTSTQQQTTYSQIASLFCGEDEQVRMEEPKHELSSWLEEDGGSKRRVFSIVGMGGSGKTTLAKNVYDGRIGSFDCHAWITVSQTSNPRELLKSIIRQFYQQEAAPATTDEIELVENLCSYLEQKRYVVIFDDVWTKEVCEDMMRVLPENNKSNRIIFTTRREDVAPSTAQSSLYRVYKLPCLPDKESFELFSRRVFQTCYKGLCPPELRGLSEGIVKKCGGLPLAIITVGGFLSRKEKNILEWKKFHDSLGSKLQSDAILERVFSLSYHDLSPILKCCLLYFSIYPEDSSIRCSRLIRQWIAEGFVNAKNNEVLEDIAEEYLKELVGRCVIEVSEKDDRGKITECRVHDVMREIASQKRGFGRYWISKVAE